MEMFLIFAISALPFLLAGAFGSTPRRALLYSGVLYLALMVISLMLSGFDFFPVGGGEWEVSRWSMQERGERAFWWILRTAAFAVLPLTIGFVGHLIREVFLRAIGKRPA